jgi:uncharacterized protein YaiI (UPF0178 family)
LAAARVNDAAPPPHLYVDADACPVKDEALRVALRYDAPLTYVANSYMRIERQPGVELVVVSDGFDAADDYIAERANSASIVVTNDILLADRCLKAGAQVVSPTGKAFTEDGIGAAIATRAIMADLRAGLGEEGRGGPPPFSKADRSKFLQALDSMMVKLRRG